MDKKSDIKVHLQQLFINTHTLPIIIPLTHFPSALIYAYEYSEMPPKIRRNLIM